MSTELMQRIKPLIPNATQRRIGQARLRTRMLTGEWRMLPDFLIIGAQRCGTGSLYKYLVQHPNVLPPLHKEVQFFSRKFGLGVHWYRSHFPLHLRRAYVRSVRRGGALTFEATPNYLFHPHAPARAASIIPRAKLIVLLRNPADRAISHYQLSVRLGFETLPFERALEVEAERLAEDREAMRLDSLHDGRSFLNFSYAARGIYSDQLKAWLDHFPRDRILVLKSEEMFEDPGRIYPQVLKFLDLPMWQPAHFRIFGTQTSGELRGESSVRISKSAREMLLELFRPHNQRLYELVGRDFGWEV